MTFFRKALVTAFEKLFSKNYNKYTVTTKHKKKIVNGMSNKKV